MRNQSDSLGEGGRMKQTNAYNNSVIDAGTPFPDIERSESFIVTD